MYIEKLHKIWLCQNDKGGIYMYPQMANRHGLIAGATGTGKTVTLKVLAESFSEMGVPVFLADIKGDVSGMCLPGEDSEGFQRRLHNKLGLETQWKFTGYPVRFWDVYGKGGLPVRTTISEMVPELLARLLELNDTQAGVLNIVFRVADEQGLLLLDFKDLRSMVQYVGDNAADFKTKYGNVTAPSIGAIQRALLRLEDQGANTFFGEPALDIKDWFATAEDGRGVINLLHATELFQNPLLYSTFLLWMLSELYEMLPEAGDLAKPKMVFFFDEAHLIFKDAPASLLDKIEQIVRLIRSKGVGIYFITQQPADVPEKVLAQLGNKLQHALRAYTPKERKALKATAQSFRENPEIDAEAALGELATGEVLVSLLDSDGIPTMVQRAYVMPPRSYLGVCSEEMRQRLIKESPLYAKYAESIDRESAYEILNAKALSAQEEAAAAAKAKEEAKAAELQAREEAKAAQVAERERKAEERRLEAERKAAERERLAAERAAARTSRTQKGVLDKVIDSAISSATRSVGSKIGNSIVRGILGSLFKGK